MPKRMANYKWRLVTRRTYLHGHDVDWREKGGARIKRRFPWKIKPRNTILWYNEWPDQEGYVRNGDTVLELALEVAVIWGFEEIAIVGADMQKVNGLAYGTPWNDWKPCKIKPEKFREMKQALRKNREKWPEKTYNLSPYWNSPFINISAEDYLRRMK
jgi:hypothetical protein